MYDLSFHVIKHDFKNETFTVVKSFDNFKDAMILLANLGYVCNHSDEPVHSFSWYGDCSIFNS